MPSPDPMPDRRAFAGNSQQLFEAVADQLVKLRADDTTKHDVLAAVMDRVGVPMMSIQRYRRDRAIIALFAERGVRLATDQEKAGHADA